MVVTIYSTQTVTKARKLGIKPCLYRSRVLIRASDGSCDDWLPMSSVNEVKEFKGA